MQSGSDSETSRLRDELAASQARVAALQSNLARTNALLQQQFKLIDTQGREAAQLRAKLAALTPVSPDNSPRASHPSLIPSRSDAHLHDLVARVDSLTREHDAMRAHAEASERARVDSQNALSELRGQHTALLTEYASALSTLSRAADDDSDLSPSKRRSQSHRQRDALDDDDDQRRISDLATQLAAQTAATHAAESLAQQRAADLRAVLTEHDSLVDAHASLQSRYGELQQRQRLEEEARLTEATRAERDQASSVAKRTEFAIELAALRGRLATAEAALVQAETDRTELSSQLAAAHLSESAHTSELAGQVASLQRDVASSAALVDTLRSERTSWVTERSRLHQSLHTLECERTGAREAHLSELDAASRQHDSFVATNFLPRIGELTAAQSNLSARNGELESKLLEAQHELKDAQKQLRATQAQLARAAESEERLRGVNLERERLQDAMKQSQDAASAAASRIHELEQSERAAQSRIDSLQTEARTREDELAKVQVELAQLKSSGSSATAELHRSAASLAQQLQQARDALAERDARIVDLEGELASRSQALHQLQEVSLPRWQVEHAALQRKCEGIEAAFQAGSIALNQSHAETERLRAALLAKQSEKYADEDAIAALRTQLEAAQSHAGSAAHDLAALRDAHSKELKELAEKHAAALAASGEQMLALSERHATATTVAANQLAAAVERHEAALSARDAAHATEVSNLRAAHATELGDLADVHSERLRSLQDELALRAREIDELRGQLVDANQDAAFLRLKQEGYVARIEALIQENATLRGHASRQAHTTYAGEDVAASASLSATPSTSSESVSAGPSSAALPSTTAAVELDHEPTSSMRLSAASAVSAASPTDPALAQEIASLKQSQAQMAAKYETLLQQSLLNDRIEQRRLELQRQRESQASPPPPTSSTPAAPASAAARAPTPEREYPVGSVFHTGPTIVHHHHHHPAPPSPTSEAALSAAASSPAHPVRSQLSPSLQSPSPLAQPTSASPFPFSHSQSPLAHTQPPPSASDPLSSSLHLPQHDMSDLALTLHNILQQSTHRSAYAAPSPDTLSRVTPLRHTTPSYAAVDRSPAPSSRRAHQSDVIAMSTPIPAHASQRTPPSSHMRMDEWSADARPTLLSLAAASPIDAGLTTPFSPIAADRSLGWSAHHKPDAASAAFTPSSNGFARPAAAASPMGGGWPGSGGDHTANMSHTSPMPFRSATSAASFGHSQALPSSATSSLGPPSSLSIPAMRAALLSLQLPHLTAQLHDLPASERERHLDLLYRHLPTYADKWPRAQYALQGASSRTPRRG